MLTIDELNAMNELSAYHLYDAEIKRLPRLTREKTPAVLERISLGDDEARHELVLGCLRFALVKAHRYYRERQPEHVDVLDLIQEASLEMMEKLDKALRANDPVAYLTTLAARAIIIHCTYYAPMIHRPEYSLKELAIVDPHPAIVESLDTPIYEDGVRLRIEHIEAPALSLTSDEAVGEHEQYRFAHLYETIKRRLAPAERAIIIRLYGFFGQPAETVSEIAQASHIKEPSVRNISYEARNKLRAVLEAHLTEMLSPQPTAEEE